MRGRVDTHLWLHESLIPTRIVRQVVADMTVPNPDYADMRRERIWGWEDVPKTIDLYDARDGWLVIPRGFARRLMGHAPELEWDDGRRYIPVDTSSWKRIIPKGPHQEAAMEVIHSAEQGIVQMPPGSGKTVAVLDGIRRAGQRALVIVDKTNIARQWQDRCQQFLGFTPGIVGEGQWDESQVITIAMQQTLWIRRDSLPQSFWEGFGFVCLDECHHASARTYYDILQRFPAAWRIGVSATPRKSAKLAPFIDAVLGETILEAPSDENVVPTVVPHITGFEYRYWPTHVKKQEMKRCGFKYCTRSGEVHRNNYNEMLRVLKNDLDRNRQIAIALRQDLLDGRHTLVVSDQLTHLKIIRDTCIDLFPSEMVDDMIMLSGEQKTPERMEIYERAADVPCIVFSTIADEALDIPRLDSIHLVWPGRNTENVKQRVGRIMRSHPKKGRPPVVNDWLDVEVPILKSQGRGRVEMYRGEGFQLSPLFGGLY